MPVMFENKQLIVVAAAGTTITAHPSTFTTYNTRAAKGVRVTIDISAFTGTSITYTIQGVDPISGNTYTLLASAAKSSTTTFSMLIYPGAVAVGNLVLNEAVPTRIKIATSGTITSVTHSISLELIY